MYHMPRVSKIANPEFAQAVAEAYIDGLSRNEMSGIFGVCTDTITAWTKDIRVQTHAAKMAQERVTRVTRRIDSAIEGRLQDTEKMETELLLKIRREFLDRSLKIDLGAGKDDPNTIKEATDLIESNPDFAAGLAALLGKQLAESDPSDDSEDEIDGD